MNYTSIFKDKSKLSSRYIPNELPHREREISQLLHIYNFYELTDPEKAELNISQIIGPTGIGKTSTVLLFSKVLEEKCIGENINIKIIYVNLKLLGGNKYIIYKYLMEKISPDTPPQGLSGEEMLKYILKFAQLNKIYIIIIIDEIDHLFKISKDTGIIYDLTRLNEFDPHTICYIKGVIFIARSNELHNKIDSAELSSLGKLPLEFSIYTLNQVCDIIDRRCVEAFHKGVIGSDVIDEVAKIVTSPKVKGDIRYALELLLYAGNLVDSNGSDRINMEDIIKVNSKIVRSFTIDDLANLTKEEILGLSAIINAIKYRKKNYVELKEIRKSAEDIIFEKDVRKFQIEDILYDLQTKNIIEFKSIKEIGLNGISIDEVQRLIKYR